MPLPVDVEQAFDRIVDDLWTALRNQSKAEFRQGLRRLVRLILVNVKPGISGHNADPE